jgi:hypothetical protein
MEKPSKVVHTLELSYTTWNEPGTTYCAKVVCTLKLIH